MDFIIFSKKRKSNVSIWLIIVRILLIFVFSIVIRNKHAFFTFDVLLV